MGLGRNAGICIAPMSQASKQEGSFKSPASKVDHPSVNYTCSYLQRRSHRIHKSAIMDAA